ncbi:phospholipid transfer protein-like [Siniperca chuatsi]|uniref:phospholipid transfer protein-like n=1 Tax=Siniperca chuatsi TaxID=119488 RepID=UPI001CE0D0F7|nr:phospholipid transfer protein-like [Siniperca chuatsi]
MTSCVLSLFFLVSLCFSVSAVDPTGLRVRITNQSLDVLKGVGLEFLKELENKRSDFSFQWKALKCSIKGLTLTRITVNPAQVVLSFQQNSGLQFEIQNLVFTGDLEREINLCLWGEFNINSGRTAFGGAGVSARIAVTLNRNQQGRLSVQMPTCEFRADNIVSGSTGIVGRALDLLIRVFQNYFTTQICPAVQTYVVPKVNSMLESFTMVTPLYEDLGINVDYSLSGDVAVTSNSLDVPFKGLVFRQGETVDAGSIRKGADPVFRESNLMAYVGVSEFFFNSAIMSFYSTGTMVQVEQVTHQAAKAALKALQLFRQPSRLRDPLSAELQVTEAPSISISERDGLTVNARARVQVFAVPAQRQQEQLLSVSATCTVNMKVAIQGNYLTLPSDNVSCKIITKNEIRDFMVKPLNSFLTDKLRGFLRGVFLKGAKIPLPEEVGFTQGKIDYHDGFLVVGGTLNVTPAGGKTLLQNFG